MKSIVLCLAWIGCSSAVQAQNQRDTLFYYFATNAAIPHSSPQIDTANVQQIILHAFTDTIGSPEKNLVLAEQRMKYVRESLDGIKSEHNIEGETTRFGADSLNRCVMVIREMKPPKIFKVVSHIGFLPGTDLIDPASYADLNELYAILAEYNFKRIDLHGHVCCGDEYALSLRRAMAIQKLFLTKGIDPSIMRCFGHSNKEPLAEENTEAGRQMNRRVEIEFERE